MDELIQLFDTIIRQADSIDIAEAEFKRQMNEYPELRHLYREWCHEVGSSEKNGFLDYCAEYMEMQNAVWDTLNDYDDIE